MERAVWGCGVLGERDERVAVAEGLQRALGLGKTVLVLPVWVRCLSYMPVEGLLMSASACPAACFSYDPPLML